jgi:asparagine synthase (glutamine-hydrolysing)
LNELPFARRVAEALGLEHIELTLDVNDVMEMLPTLIGAYDQPFGDASSVPTYAVSKLARTRVKVCLSGDGGDESFAGYWRPQSVLYANRYSRLVPSGIRRWLASNRFQHSGLVPRRVAALNRLSLGQRGSGYTNSQSWFSRMEDLAGPALQPGLSHDVVSCRVGTSRTFQNTTILQRALYDDLQVQLADDYLRKVDVASMAASLEVRAPLLDVALLELAWSLPDKAKLYWGARKYLLKRAAARLVPPEVIYRRKMGFGMPLNRWFREELGNYLGGLLESSEAAALGWINIATATAALLEHQRGTRNHDTRLWLLLWFELWCRKRKHHQSKAKESLMKDAYQVCAS